MLISVNGYSAVGDPSNKKMWQIGNATPGAHTDMESWESKLSKNIPGNDQAIIVFSDCQYNKPTEYKFLKNSGCGTGEANLLIADWDNLIETVESCDAKCLRFGDECQEFAYVKSTGSCKLYRTGCPKDGTSTTEEMFKASPRVYPSTTGVCTHTVQVSFDAGIRAYCAATSKDQCPVEPPIKYEFQEIGNRVWADYRSHAYYTGRRLPTVREGLKIVLKEGPHPNGLTANMIMPVGSNSDDKDLVYHGGSGDGSAWGHGRS